MNGKTYEIRPIRPIIYNYSTASFMFLLLYPQGKPPGTNWIECLVDLGPICTRWQRENFSCLYNLLLGFEL
jgi:hypothetical protein